MKDTKRFISVTTLILLLIMGLTSCGNLLTGDIAAGNESSSSGNRKHTGSITGSITTVGALPSQLARRPSSSARTAFPNQDFSDEYFDFYVTATPTSGTEVSRRFTGNSFSLGDLSLDKTYTISVKATVKDNSSKVVLSGTASEPVTLSESNPAANLGEISLTAGNTGIGNINLRIYTSTHNVDSVSAFLTVGDGSTESQFKEFIWEQNATQGYADIIVENKQIWALTLEFYEDVTYNGESNKITVYQCKEAVNTFTNMTTDTWVKNGQEPYFTNEGGTVKFLLTDDCLSQFAMNTFFVDPNPPEGHRQNTGTQFDPFTTLQNAIIAVSNSPTDDPKKILIKAGTTVDEPSEGIVLSSAANATASNLTLDVYDGSDTNTTATIRKTTDGNSLILLNDDGTLTASNINFTNPNNKKVAEIGAGSFIDSGSSSASATLTNCSFSNPRTQETTATSIYSFSAPITLENCVFDTPENGYAIYHMSDAVVTIKNCTFNNTYSNIGGLGSLTVNGKNAFNNGSRIEYNLSHSITVGTDFDTDSEIPVYIADINSSLNRTILTGNLEETTECFTLTGITNSQDYMISSNGTFMLKNILYVGSNGNDEDAAYGYSANKPFATLAHAIDKCGTSLNYTIWVEGNTSEGSITANTETIQRQFDIKNKKIDIKVTATLSSPAVDGSKKQIKLVKGNSIEGQFQITDGSKVSFTGFDFIREGTPGSGGFIGVGGNSSCEASFTNCTFKNASVTGKGGAICNANNGKLSLTGCTFSNNSAADTKNDVYSQGTSVTLYNGNTFDGGIELASEKKITIGEAFSDTQTDIKLKLSSYTANTEILTGDSENVAGAYSYFALSNTSWTISTDGKIHEGFGSTIYVDSHNEAAQDAPGYGTSADKPFATLAYVLNKIPSDGTQRTIKVKSGHTEVLEDTSISSTRSLNVSVTVYDDLTSTTPSTTGKATLSFNYRSNYLYIDSGNTFAFNNIEFIRNDTTDNYYNCGTGLIACKGNLTLTNCLLDGKEHESATQTNAGLLCIWGSSTANCTGCTFQNGIAGETGGAISIEDSATLTLKDCTFTNNYADNKHGGKNDVLHAGTSFTLCSGNTFDGGIELASEKKITIGEAFSDTQTDILLSFAISSQAVALLSGESTYISSAYDKFTLPTGFKLNSSGITEENLPATLYVNSTANISGTGFSYGYSADRPYQTLSAALAKITDDTERTIIIQGTSFSEEISKSFSADRNFTIDATQVSVGAQITGSLSFGSSSGSYQCIVTIKGLTINGKTTSGNGGVIFCGNNTSLTLESCKIMNGNTTSSGGAIYNNASTITLKSCEFSNNIDSSGPNDIYCTGSVDSKVILKAGNKFAGGIKFTYNQGKNGSIEIAEQLSTTDGTIPLILNPTSASSNANTTSALVSGDYAESAISNGLITLDDDTYVLGSDGKLVKKTYLYVDNGTGTDSTGYGSAPSTPYKTLAHAISQAGTGSPCIVKIKTDHSETVSADIQINTNTTIGVYDDLSSSTPTTTGTATINFSDDMHISIASGKSASFSNITFKRSTELDGDGGLIYCAGNLTLNTCILDGTGGLCKNGNGGLLYVSNNGSAVCTACTFSGGKTTGFGGAIFARGSVTVDGCSFSDCYHRWNGTTGTENTFYCEGPEAESNLKLLTINGTFTISAQTASAQTIYLDKGTVVVFGSDYEFGNTESKIYWCVDNEAAYTNMGTLSLFVDNSSKSSITDNMAYTNNEYQIVYYTYSTPPYGYLY